LVVILILVRLCVGLILKTCRTVVSAVTPLAALKTSTRCHKTASFFLGKSLRSNVSYFHRGDSHMIARLRSLRLRGSLRSLCQMGPGRGGISGRLWCQNLTSSTIRACSSAWAKVRGRQSWTSVAAAARGSRGGARTWSGC